MRFLLPLCLMGVGFVGGCTPVQATAPPVQPAYCRGLICVSSRPAVFAKGKTVAPTFSMPGGEAGPLVISYRELGKIVISLAKEDVKKCKSWVRNDKIEIIEHYIRIENRTLNYLGPECKIIRAEIQAMDGDVRNRLRKLMPVVWILSQENLYLVRPPHILLPFEALVDLGK